jgi:DNA polymerase III delta prime subunit
MANGNANSFFTNLTTQGAQVAYGKFGFEGPPGSGKTTTAGLLAVGISKEFYGGAPVVWVDSENGANFIRPIFLAEKVDLLVVPTSDLAMLKKSVLEAQKAGAKVLVPDSMTRFWTKLVGEYKKVNGIKNDKQMLSHWNTVKEPWREWTEMFLNCPLHVIACGRGGFEFDSIDIVENGEVVGTETVKGDYKMKGEGEFGHEPDVNLHFQSMTDPNAPTGKIKKGRGRTASVDFAAARKIHVATVQKGRVWQMNGKVFKWYDRDAYKAGEYKLVLDCFRPYLEALNIGGTHQPIQSGENNFASNAQDRRNWTKKQIALEEWETTMKTVFSPPNPINTQMRRLVGEYITNGIRSKTEFERQDGDALEYQLRVLRKFEERTKIEGFPVVEDGDGKKHIREADLQALVEIAREEVNAAMKNPLGDLGISGKDMKIEEAMNVGQVLDQQARDEAIF